MLPQPVALTDIDGETNPTYLCLLVKGLPPSLPVKKYQYDLGRLLPLQIHWR